jgi:hypothetical protein
MPRQQLPVREELRDVCLPSDTASRIRLSCELDEFLKGFFRLHGEVANDGVVLDLVIEVVGSCRGFRGGMRGGGRSSRGGGGGRSKMGC